jgi:hypothetical protein
MSVLLHMLHASCEAAPATGSEKPEGSFSFHSSRHSIRIYEKAIPHTNKDMFFYIKWQGDAAENALTQYQF